MLRIPKRRSISRSIFSILIFCTIYLNGQDTLRTYGPRVGLDLARFAYLLTDPREIGAEISADLEIYKNIFPVFEAGYNSISLQAESFSYASRGSYGRIGMDYNLLPVIDRSVHHSIFLGFRYGLSPFKHRAQNITAPNSYWGEYALEEYTNTLTGQWLELTGGVKAEVFNNFFLGWTVRYKFLLNKGMEDTMSPFMIPGYGKANSVRTFGISYSLLYKIPVYRK